tara:strand:- start:148 stop:603 length:456 start_codon:yes stop_codon:yes gene_type:complete
MVSNFSNILGIIGFCLIMYALYNYSITKTSNISGYTVINNSQNDTSNHVPEQNISEKSNEPITNQSISNPSDLLPSDPNQGWSNLNPVPNNNGNFLHDRKLNAIDTKGSSLRNANLQLRSDIPIPIKNTNCPWNNSTIEADNMRRPLDIGA